MSLNLLDLTESVLYRKKLSISFQANDLIFFIIVQRLWAT